MPSYFWLDGLVDEVLEFGVIAVAQEGADLKPSFCLPATPRRQTAVELSSDPRLRITAMRIGPLCLAIAAGTGVGAVASAAVDCSRPSVIRESAIFSCGLPCKMLSTALKIGQCQRASQHQPFNNVHRVIRQPRASPARWRARRGSPPPPAFPGRLVCRSPPAKSRSRPRPPRPSDSRRRR